MLFRALANSLVVEYFAVVVTGVGSSPVRSVFRHRDEYRSASRSTSCESRRRPDAGAIGAYVAAAKSDATPTRRSEKPVCCGAVCAVAQHAAIRHQTCDGITGQAPTGPCAFWGHPMDHQRVELDLAVRVLAALGKTLSPALNFSAKPTASRTMQAPASHHCRRAIPRSSSFAVFRCRASTRPSSRNELSHPLFPVGAFLKPLVADR